MIWRFHFPIRKYDFKLDQRLTPSVGLHLSSRPITTIFEYFPINRTFIIVYALLFVKVYHLMLIFF